MRVHDNGAYFTVTVTAVEVRKFKATWPCSGLPGTRIWFQFDKRNGDLVDIGPYHYAHRIDGPAAAALSQDAQRYGAARLQATAKKTVNLALERGEPHEPQPQSRQRPH